MRDSHGTAMILSLAAALCLPVPGLAQQNTVKELEQKAERYLETGQAADAVKTGEEAIRIVEKQKGDESPDLIPMLRSLGRYWGMVPGGSEKRIAAELRALAIAEKAYGREDPKLLPLLRGLSALYTQQKKYSESEAAAKRALAIAEKTYGPESSMAASQRMSLALGYLWSKRYAEAETMFRRTLAIYEKTEKFEHGGHASVHEGLARVYLAQRKYAEADAELQRAIQYWGGPDAQKRFISPDSSKNNLNRLNELKTEIERARVPSTKK